MPHRDTRELCEPCYYQPRCSLCGRMLEAGKRHPDFPSVCWDCGPEWLHEGGSRVIYDENRESEIIPNFAKRANGSDPGRWRAWIGRLRDAET